MWLDLPVMCTSLEGLHAMKQYCRYFVCRLTYRVKVTLEGQECGLVEEVFDLLAYLSLCITSELSYRRMKDWY